MKRPAFAVKLQAGDILLCRHRTPVFKEITGPFLGTYIAHNFMAIDNKNTLIEASIHNNISTKSLESIMANHNYIHVFRLKRSLFSLGDIDKIVFKVTKYGEALTYSKRNIIGHSIFNILRNAESRFRIRLTNVHKNIDEKAFLYRPTGITCSQLIFRAMHEALSESGKLKQFYAQLDNDDIRSFFPHKLAKLSDYQYTIFPSKHKAEKLTQKQRIMLDTHRYPAGV